MLLIKQLTSTDLKEGLKIPYGDGHDFFHGLSLVELHDLGESDKLVQLRKHEASPPLTN